jgi:hypothetical protein
MTKKTYFGLPLSSFLLAAVIGILGIIIFIITKNISIIVLVLTTIWISNASYSTGYQTNRIKTMEKYLKVLEVMKEDTDNDEKDKAIEEFDDWVFGNQTYKSWGGYSEKNKL